MYVYVSKGVIIYYDFLFFAAYFWQPKPQIRILFKQTAESEKLAEKYFIVYLAPCSLVSSFLNFSYNSETIANSIHTL